MFSEPGFRYKIAAKNAPCLVGDGVLRFLVMNGADRN